MSVCGLACVLFMTANAQAQDHLEPETGTLGEFDEYYYKISRVFAAAYDKNVVCKTMMPGAQIGTESAVGVRKTPKGYEVFQMYASSRIWDTELVREYEAGRIGTYNKEGRKLTLAENEDYQKLKKKTPADFRTITTTTKSVPIDDALASRIAAIWERMLLATRQPKVNRSGVDGGTLHFSMFVMNRGIISGQVWSPDKDTKTGALCDLAITMLRFANGTSVDLATLNKEVSRVEKIIMK